MPFRRAFSPFHPPLSSLSRSSRCESQKVCPKVSFFLVRRIIGVDNKTSSSLTYNINISSIVIVRPGWNKSEFNLSKDLKCKKCTKKSLFNSHRSTRLWNNDIPQRAYKSFRCLRIMQCEQAASAITQSFYVFRKTVVKRLISSYIEFVIQTI